MSTLAQWIGWAVLVTGGVCLALVIVWGGLYLAAVYAATRKATVIDIAVFIRDRRARERAQAEYDKKCGPCDV